ncbi:MAG: DUF5939 domain-containing protein [Granulosicoccus sp.]
MTHKINEQMLDEKLEQLESISVWGPRVISKFEALLQSEDDLELFRINPIRYANERRMDHSEAINLFLHAATIGLLEMQWNMVCSSCASVYGSFEHLKSVASHFNCPVCKNENTTSLDELMHVTFGIVPQIRDNAFNHPEALSVEDYYFHYHTIEGSVYPPDLDFKEALKQFAKHLDYIDPGETKVYDLQLVPGAMMVRNVESEAAAMFSVHPEHENPVSTLSLGYDEDSLSCADQDNTAGVIEFGDLKFYADVMGVLGAGPLKLSIKNESKKRGALLIIVMPPIEPKPLLFKPFLSGKKLLSNQTFRDLYRSETIGISDGIAVNDLTLMFTDLTDSTALYDKVGDPQAFFLVQQHFARLKEIIVENNGAIIKTIGDAVMATFVHPVDAVNAALGVLDTIERFNESISESVAIKVGLHRGYCIAITSNEQQDYFGQTVNTAARIQGLAGPRQIYLSREVHDFEGVQSLIESQCHIEHRTEKVKGIEKPLDLFRLSRRSEMA